MMSFSRIKGVYLRYYYTFWKGPQQLSDIFYWPTVDILLWGLTSVWIQTQHNVASLPLFIMTALIFWQITWRGSNDIAVNILQEFWHRNLMNLFSTPLKISEWVAGVILLGLSKVFLAVCFGAVMIYLLYALNVFTIGLFFIPFAALLLMFGWAIGFIAAGILIYWGHQLEMIAWTLPFFFAPFSAVFYPVEVLPNWAQSVAWCLPSTYIFEGMRQILQGNPFPVSYIVTSFLLNLLFLGVSILFFVWMFQKGRIKGLGRLE